MYKKHVKPVIFWLTFYSNWYTMLWSMALMECAILLHIPVYLSNLLWSIWWEKCPLALERMSVDEAICCSRALFVRTPTADVRYACAPTFMPLLYSQNRWQYESVLLSEVILSEIDGMCTANQKPCKRAAVATRARQCYASLYSTSKHLNQNVSVAKIIC